MLKIDTIENGDDRLTLKLAGRLVGPWVAELQRCCDEALATGRRPILDFSDVTFVDRDGTSLVRGMRGRATVVHCSGFVSEQLKAWQEFRG